jgi:hypothetical protein
MYCQKCGNEISENEMYCTICGTRVAKDEEGTNVSGENNPNNMYEGTSIYKVSTKNESNGLKVAAKVFLILGAVLNLFSIWFSFVWSIPMIIIYFTKVKKGEKIGIGFKIGCMLLVSMLGGIFMLCDKEQ